MLELVAEDTSEALKHHLSKVARSTFCQGAKSSPEKAKKEPNPRTRGQERPTISPNLSAVAKSCELILSNRSNGNIPPLLLANGPHQIRKKISEASRP